MLKLNNTKTTSIVLVVAMLAAIMTIGPVVSSFPSALAHYGVDKDQCKDDEDYYDDNEEACDKNLREHYDNDYNGNYGSKNIDDDDDDNGGNNANQGIGQSQSSRQNSQCVSGDDTNDSCNNLSFQNQENEGNNAAAQSGGNNDDDDDNGGNSANQGIGQSQSSKQNSQVVSGDDTEDSGNNLSFQNQENEGNNVLAQQ